jgi:hypothetical protein
MFDALVVARGRIAFWVKPPDGTVRLDEIIDRAEREMKLP